GGPGCSGPGSRAATRRPPPGPASPTARDGTPRRVPPGRDGGQVHPVAAGPRAAGRPPARPVRVELRLAPAGRDAPGPCRGLPARTRFAALILAAATLAPAAAQAPKDKAPPDKKDPQAAIEPRSGPGAGQKFLERFAGDWDVVKTFHPRQGEPVTAKGTCRQE